MTRANICEETRNRIRVSVAAYAYEFAEPIMSDVEYDTLARSVDLSKSTSRPDLDGWFCNNFSADTGMWIRNHPELQRIKAVYDTNYGRTPSASPFPKKNPRVTASR